jgi:hypothetical protein
MPWWVWLIMFIAASLAAERGVHVVLAGMDKVVESIEKANETLERIEGLLETVERTITKPERDAKWGDGPGF